MSEKLSERIAIHFDNEPLTPGVRNYWSKRAAALEAKLEAMGKAIVALAWVGPAHDFEGNDLEDYVTVELSQLERLKAAQQEQKDGE